MAAETAWCGAFPGSGLQGVLEGFDVLVVPSVWYENAPLVISEARATGIPVVASRLGGMAEMVRDGVDGLLFAPGDDRALAAALRRLATEEGLLDRLREGNRPPRWIDDEVGDLRSVYAGLIGAGS